MKSKIFSEIQMDYVEKRLEGDRKDPHGTYARQVKPVLKEILNFWIPLKKKIEKLLAKKPIPSIDRDNENKIRENNE